MKQGKTFFLMTEYKVEESNMEYGKVVPSSLNHNCLYCISFTRIALQTLATDWQALLVGKSIGRLGRRRNLSKGSRPL